MSEKQITIGIITAIREEWHAVSTFIDDLKIEHDSDGLPYGAGIVKKSKLPQGNETIMRIVLPAPDAVGNVDAAIMLTRLEKHKPDIFAMVGCAGGIPGKVNLYDVVFADRVIYYEPGKQEETDYIPRPDLLKTYTPLLQQAKIASTNEEWKLAIDSGINTEFHARVEPVASGENVVNSTKAELTKFIQKVASRAVAIETDGYGVMEAAHKLDLNAIVVRGISDMLDKPSYDEVCPNTAPNVAGMNRKQIDATHHAMAFLCYIISKSTPLLHPKQPPSGRASARLVFQTSLDNLDSVLAAIKKFGGDLPFEVININVGSIVIDAICDIVFASVLFTLWEKDVLFDIIPFKVSNFVVSNIKDTTAMIISEHIKTSLSVNNKNAQTSLLALKGIITKNRRYGHLLNVVLNVIYSRQSNISEIGDKSQRKITLIIPQNAYTKLSSRIERRGETIINVISSTLDRLIKNGITNEQLLHETIEQYKDIEGHYKAAKKKKIVLKGFKIVQFNVSKRQKYALMQMQPIFQHEDIDTIVGTIVLLSVRALL